MSGTYEAGGNKKSVPCRLDAPRLSQPMDGNTGGTYSGLTAQEFSIILVGESQAHRGPREGGTPGSVLFYLQYISKSRGRGSRKASLP